MLALVVDWNTLPKGRRGNPFCRSKVVAIRGPLTREIAELLRGLGNFQQLCPLSTDQFSRLLGADNATKLYSAHSVKRGAIDHLMNMKAAGAPFALQLISRLAKHTNDADPTVANMTVRYTSDPVALARVLQTGDVTRGKRTRLPGTEEEKKSPLHVDSVPSMDVAVLRRRMNAPTRKRFDETWSRTFYPQTFPSKTSSPPGRSRFEAAHAFELEEHGIAERAAGPGRDMNVPFTVVEEKERKLRQRFILWTYDANRVVEADGYEAHVPLSHVSKYLHAVNRECGSTRDFSDGDGNWWQLTRLPIGHSCAPELMYTLASTTAGHPDYVDGKHAVSSEVLVHVWVDNIRYAGPRNLVLKATSYPDALAAEARITSKAADTRNAACRYEFLGVDWKHSDGTVGVSAKMQSRLQRAEESVRAGKMSAAEIKSLAGRLLHASAIAGVYVGEYYFALKFFRLTNALNRGEKCLDENVVLSHGLQRALPSWMQRVQRRRIVPVAAQSPKLAVFVDASLDGWGGVLVDVDTNDMVVVGSCWNRVEKRLHINQLEAMAFERSVKAISPAYAGSTVTVIVDNTSVQGIGRIDVLEIMFAEVAGFDLQHLLAVLLMLESKDALSVNKAVAKVVPGFVVPPPGPRPKEDASSKSFGEATTQQQLQQILMQQQRQQEMMMQRLQQVQQELQTVKAQAAAWPPAPQQHWPEEKCRLFLRSSGRRASASRPARDFEFDEAGICWLHGGRNRRGQAAPLLVHETTAARGELAQTSDDPMERAAAKVECARAKKWECTSAIRRQR
ncbi:hypothetical protein DIPPA_31198 [Diplonema papillatum]|nr:hypothetical protein DIPPA_09107 [Diplonema papillatum]KAJ9441135.1 hypothetical protein DIPPA_21821 [Diplonema papillatum]KAJ9444382.1 hypothetical protein DIPPA_31198 [Diplonema papillatum]